MTENQKETNQKEKFPNGAAIVTVDVDQADKDSLRLIGAFHGGNMTTAARAAIREYVERERSKVRG